MRNNFGYYECFDSCNNNERVVGQKTYKKQISEPFEAGLRVKLQAESSELLGSCATEAQ